MIKKQKKGDKNSDAQRKRSKGGYKFEKEVFEYLDAEIGSNPKINLLRPRSRAYLPGSTRPHTFSCMQITTPYGDIIGDTDIVVYHVRRKTPLMLISCKTSLRERLAQSLFHFYLYRKIYPNIKLFFVTKDKSLEMGSIEKPNKNRILLESENVYCYTQNPNTKTGGCVKPFGNMVIDIKRMAGIDQKQVAKPVKAVVPMKAAAPKRKICN
ncbi:MAG TPA: BsaWI family type II restriction enzyme [Methanoregula sp.]|nr:BsaWI family type II restriction enzyme [Methanoregula sp.]